MRNAGLKFGIYFCHRDWGDPDFCATMEHENFREKDPVRRQQMWDRFIAKRNAKVKEILTRYGKVDLFWADENWGATAEQLHCEEMIEIMLNCQPSIVINNPLQGFRNITSLPYPRVRYVLNFLRRGTGRPPTSRHIESTVHIAR